jgi:hypothetical protein
MAEALQLRSLPYAKQERKWFGFNSFDSCGIALFKQDFAALRRLHHTTLHAGSPIDGMPARPILGILVRSRWAGVTYRVLGLERTDAVTMQCGIFDWPAFLSQAVPPKSSISAEIMVMRLALLHVFYRYLLMRCGIIPAKVDTLVHFAKDRVAFLGRNRWRRHCSNQRGIRCGASLAGARRQWLRNRLRPNDLGWSRHYCSTQRSILHRASKKEH